MEPDAALLDLLRYLKGQRYRFQTVTPATHARVLWRPRRTRPTLRDVFGWNRPFDAGDIADELLALMRRAEILRSSPDGFSSALRVASLGDDLFLHSAFPTDEAGAVFFGPDTYRFARFIADRWPTANPARVVDMGAGTGAGGIVATRLDPLAQVSLVDSNPEALRLAAVNARAAGAVVELREDKEAPRGADLIIANPPYIMDPASRTYRDGGDLLGGAVALQWTRDALHKLNPGGWMLLYTGAAIKAGTSPLVDALTAACDAAGATISGEELDPDVFGEELEHEAYAEVERIAALGIVIGVQD